jgi:hypothetical protein
MNRQELMRLKEVLDVLDDLANTTQYYCIGIYGIIG